MKFETEKLKKEEKLAWVETTKNIVQANEALKPELSALNQLMEAGQKHDENIVDVKVIDRIKEEYMNLVEKKMSQCKGVDERGLTNLEIKEKKEINEKRKLGVKAFQARTTYELGLDPDVLKKASPEKLLQSNTKYRPSTTWQQQNAIALKEDSSGILHQRENIARMGNFELRYTRNKAYSFNSTVTVKDLQTNVRDGVMQFRNRLTHNHKR